MQTIQKHSSSRNDNPRRGGQATIGLFGVPDAGHSCRAQALPVPTPPARPQHDDRPKVIDGLTFGQRRARIRAWVAHPLPSRSPAPPTLRLRACNFAAFVRLAEREHRPVSEVMEEWLADCARLIGRDELHEDSSFATTPAMRCVARASDERERCPCLDDEHADFLHRKASTGYVEITLALEG